MEYIELARRVLEEDKWNLVIVKEGETLLTSKERRVAPLLQAIETMGEGLHNAAIADRIDGSATAMLCLHARIASVYADTGSRKALGMLKKKKVAVSSKNVVPHSPNYDGTDLCPFEKLAASCRKPSQLLAALQDFFAEGAQ